MTFVFPEVVVGEPTRCQSLSVFPLFLEKESGNVDYLLSDEAIESGAITVKETSEAGSVPELLVENRDDRRVLFLEGAQLAGAKQNRMVNASFLVPAKNSLKIPVSCVEQRRWGYRSRHFTPAESHSPASLRYLLKASVTDSLSKGRGYKSNQMGVWAEVASLQDAAGTPSDTAGLRDTYECHRKWIADFRSRLAYVDGAFGLAMALGNKVVAFELFGRSITCRTTWDRFVAGYVPEAVLTTPPEGDVRVSEVQRLLDAIQQVSWQVVDSVGEGTEYRAERDGGEQASVLTLHGVLIHASGMANPN